MKPQDDSGESTLQSQTIDADPPSGSPGGDATPYSLTLTRSAHAEPF